MAADMPPGNPSHHEALDMSLSLKPKWYFTKEEIDEHSPSRKDGIDCEYESHLRKLYCSYLQEVGMELKVPQVTIATAMMLCHRFYMRQSHAKNHWQAVANASMFLACKAEDTPVWLKELIFVSYKLMYKWDPLAAKKIRRKEVYDKQKELILVGEQMILVNVAFDLNIEHPYKLVVAALKRMEISDKAVFQVAWNYVNDWLSTTLCLQYKPHYIAAGSVFLASKHQNIKLPSTNGKQWWMQFDISQKELQEVTEHMVQLLRKNAFTTQPASASGEANTKQKPMEDTSRTFSKAPESSQPNLKQPDHEAIVPVKLTENCLSESSSANSVVEDCDAGHNVTRELGQKSGCQIVSVKRSRPEMDVDRIREKIKIRKLERVGNERLGCSLGDEMSGEDWIEHEIEKGIKPVSASS